MDGHKFQFGQQLIEIPWWWLDGLLIWIGLLGLVLWVLGRRLVKPTFAVVGLTLGAVFTAGFVKSQWPETVAGPWIAGGAVVGGVAAWLMWRLMVAAVLGVTLAIVVPWAVLTWTGTELPDLWSPIPKAMERMDEAVAENKPIEVPVIWDEATAGVSGAWDGWWGGLEASKRWMLLGGGVGAGSLALLVGIALPQLAASVSTALLGVLLMMGGVVRLAGLMPESVAAWLPDTPRGTVVAVLGAAVIGALVQWTILRKRADS